MNEDIREASIRNPRPVILNEAVEQALRNYSRTGWGASIPDEDQEAVRDFVIKTLVESGLDQLTAIKLVHLMEGGRWADGWETGYGSAKNHYAPKAG